MADPSIPNLKFDVFGLGHCCLDHLSILDPYPEKGKKGIVIESCITGGGPVPTALRVVTRFGGTAAFCGKVGDDKAGKQIISELRADNIDTQQMAIDPLSTTACATIWIDPSDGSRTIALDTPEYPWVTDEQLNAKMVKDCRVFFTDGRAKEATLSGLRTARQAGIPTVFDTGSYRPGLYNMLPLIDFAIVSQDFADHIRSIDFQQDIRHSDNISKARTLAIHLIRSGVKQAFITLGEQGVLWHNGQETIVSSAFPIKVYDTTGAGDVFHGAFIHGLLQEWAIEKILRFSNASASLSCLKLSGSGGIPTLEDVNILVDPQ